MTTHALTTATLLFALTFPTPRGSLTIAMSESPLTRAEQTLLRDLLDQYRARTTNEFAVVVVPSLQGASIEEFANRLFHQWGIGKADKDNGLLLLWAPTERKVRIEVGYGLEAALTDGRAGQIIREQITPAFRQQRWFTGLHEGITEVMAVIDQNARVRPVAPPAVAAATEAPVTRVAGTEPAPDDGSGLVVIATIFGLGLLLAAGCGFFFWRWRRKNQEDEARSRQVMLGRIATDPQDDYRAPLRHYNPPVRSPSVRRYEPPVVVAEDVVVVHHHHHEPVVQHSYVAPKAETRRDDTSSSDVGFSGGDSGGAGASGDY